MDLLQQKMGKYVTRILSLPYLSKKTVLITDLLLISIIFTVSFFLCDNLAGKPLFPKLFAVKLVLCVGLNCLFFLLFSTYRGVLRYSSFRDAPRILFSLLCANAVLLAILLFVSPNSSMVSTISVFINLALSFSAIIFFRMTVRLFFDYFKTFHTGKKHLPLLIFGTNLTHISIARMILDNEYLPYSLSGFISSEPHISDQKILNCPIYSKNDFLSNAIPLQTIRALLIVSEELEYTEKQLLIEKCTQNKIELLTAPSLNDWRTGEKKTQKIDRLRIEDLLGRFPIHIDTESIEHNLNDKTVLITGAAGSIGSEIVRQLCGFKVKKLLLCDIAESPLHQLGLELNDNYPSVKIQLFIADVRSYERMKIIFEQYAPQYIYHAAAYKHVPLMEVQPSEAIFANVLGTKNIADLAIKYKAECFVMISTDKAVNPSSVMGASKRIAEIYVQYLSHNPVKKEDELTTRFITTRFGNVLGSNGSVMLRFSKQIEAGGPITVTHPNIIRYFMTISEACNLVLEAGLLGKGGEIFVFDMGESVKIKEMAETMIRLSGLEPYKDIDIVFTGLRPGEKLYEELLYDKEKKLPTNHEKIMISKADECNYEEVIPKLFHLIEIATSDDNHVEIVKLMKEIVPEFISQNSPYSDLDPDNNSKKHSFT